MSSARVLAAAALFVAASAPLSAQHASPLHAGGWIISGGGSAGRTHYDGDQEGDITHINLQPTGLVFVTSHFAVGGTIPLSYNGFSNPSGHAFGFGIGPAARYYFAADTARWLPFIGASVQPQWQEVHETVVALGNTTRTVDFENRVVTADGSLGLTRLVAQHVGVSGELYYTHSALHTSLGPNGPKGSSDVGARFGLTVFVH